MFSTNFITGVGSGSIPLDPDALAFLTAAGITDPTQKFAINNLVLDLKFYNIYNKLVIAYPFVGGSASSHSYNLINPAANQLVFSGGWTHSATGALPNGTNAYADPDYIPSVYLQNSLHISYYSRTNTPGMLGSLNQVEMGADQGIPGAGIIRMQIRSSSNNFLVRLHAGLGSQAANANSQGFFTGSRENSANQQGYKNGVLTVNASQVSGAPTSIPLLIAARNGFSSSPPGYVPASFTDREVAFSSVGLGLSAGDVTNFYNSVQTYQTTLSRQV